MRRWSAFVRSVAVAALFAGSIGAFVGAAPARAVEDFGIEPPPGARKVGEHRWQVDRNYEATLKFFREKFRGSKNVRWMREVSLPAVKYVHLENANEASGWDGLNIYQMPDGSVRMYFLTRRPPSSRATSTTPTTSTPDAPAPAARP